LGEEEWESGRKWTKKWWTAVDEVDKSEEILNFGFWILNWRRIAPLRFLFVLAVPDVPDVLLVLLPAAQLIKKGAYPAPFFIIDLICNSALMMPL
jgi:hypothetical protein